MLYEDPPPGISAWWPNEQDAREIHAVVEGAEGTPYAKGRFRLTILVPPNYPFGPPKVQYVTPIYHPNIDSAGRICLDILNMPTTSGKGAWKPSLNLSTVLNSLRLLMSEPNPDDGLMVEITHEFIHNRARFERTAIEHTAKHAMMSDAADSAAAAADGAAAAAAPSGADAGAPSAESAAGEAASSTRPREEGTGDAVAEGAEAKRPKIAHD